MNMGIKKITAAALIASGMLAGSLATAFAGGAGAADSRGPQWPNGDGGGWQGDGGGYRHGDGPGVGPFLFGGLAQEAYPQPQQPYDDDSCYQLRPTYDQWNNFAGRQWVNVCN